ncbi:ring finger domain-containing protein [Ditylenchus destructor]|nr:ring finger domain-containing protein [Ditylenchus destructor]
MEHRPDTHAILSRVSRMVVIVEEQRQPSDAHSEPSHYCYQCQQDVQVLVVSECPKCCECSSEFVEELDQEDVRILSEPEVVRQPSANAPSNPPPTPQDNETRELQDIDALLQNNPDLTREVVNSSIATSLLRFILSRDTNQPPPDAVVIFELPTLRIMLDDEEQDKGLSAEDIERLPIFEVDESVVAKETQCPTCLDAFELNQKVVKLDCEHLVHKPCIEPWLQKANTCPVCRYELHPENWPVLNSTSKNVPPLTTLPDLDELD